MERRLTSYAGMTGTSPRSFRARTSSFNTSGTRRRDNALGAAALAIPLARRLTRSRGFAREREPRRWRLPSGNREADSDDVPARRQAPQPGLCHRVRQRFARLSAGSREEQIGPGIGRRDHPKDACNIRAFADPCAPVRAHPHAPSRRKPSRALDPRPAIPPFADTEEFAGTAPVASEMYAR
jgi:hypothetical protein